MLRTTTLDDTISEYYDNEMGRGELFDYEARLANSRIIRDYTNDTCFEYFKISNSIKLVKNRASQNAQRLVDFTIAKNQKELFDFNPVFLERVYEYFRNVFLNINRNNPK